MIDIKECPFCGSDAAIECYEHSDYADYDPSVGGPYTYRIKCDDFDCRAETPAVSGTENEIPEAVWDGTWNWRLPSSGTKSVTRLVNCPCCYGRAKLVRINDDGSSVRIRVTGKHPDSDDDKYRFAVECQGCGLQIESWSVIDRCDSGRLTAIRRWNTRVKYTDRELFGDMVDDIEPALRR